MKFVAFTCTLCLATGIWAQSLTTVQSRKSSVLILSPSSRSANDVSILERKQVEVVKGAPYSATMTKETRGFLPDGNRIVKRASAFVARDSDGRTLQASVSEGAPLTAAKWKMLADPIAQATYVFATPGTVSDKGILAQFSNPQGRSEFIVADGLEDATPEPPGEVKLESLGTQIMEGVLVEGSRETRTIAAGTAGNEQPFSITSEVWYSPTLHITVLKKHKDPRTGETEVRLTEIKLAEPDPSLFRVPAEDQIKLNELAVHSSHSE